MVQGMGYKLEAFFRRSFTKKSTVLRLAYSEEI